EKKLYILKDFQLGSIMARILSPQEHVGNISLNDLLELATVWKHNLMTIPMFFDKSDQIAIVDFLTKEGLEYEHYGYEEKGDYIESMIIVNVPAPGDVLKNLPSGGVRFEDP